MLKYDLGSSSSGKVGGRCPKNTVPATQYWSRSNIVDLMRESLIEQVFPDLVENGNADDVDKYVCEDGVYWRDDAVSGTSCVKPYKKSAVINGVLYGSQEEVAIIYGSITYKCPNGGRVRSVAFNGVVPYNSQCVPTSEVFGGLLQ